MTPDSPSTMKSRASLAVGATNAMRPTEPDSRRAFDHSAPVRVFPNPRPARISQVSHQSPAGASCSGRATQSQRRDNSTRSSIGSLLHHPWNATAPTFAIACWSFERPTSGRLPLGLALCECLPTKDGGVAPARRQLHREHPRLQSLARDDLRAAAAEGLVTHLAGTRVVAHRDLEQLDGLLRRVNGLAAIASDVPDAGLVLVSVPRRPRSLLPAVEARLVRPVIHSRSREHKPWLHPDYLAMHQEAGRGH